MRVHSEEMEIFVTVVESGSFTGAAERLKQANSAVSRSIKKLEQKLGVMLLNRTTRHISLTQEGEQYYRRVRQILREMAAAEDALIDAPDHPSGLLRIDAATPVVLHLIAPHLKTYRQLYPQMQISLDSSETFINLIERKVDIAIRVGELQDSSLRAKKLLSSYRRILASPAYLARAPRLETVADLARHSCLAFKAPFSLNRWPIAQPDGQLYEITPAITANSGETLRQLCLRGNGLACLSDFMTDADIRRGALVPVLVPHTLPIEMPINAVFYSDLTVSHRLRSFIDFISRVLAEPDHAVRR